MVWRKLTYVEEDRRTRLAMEVKRANGLDLTYFEAEPGSGDFQFESTSLHSSQSLAKVSFCFVKQRTENRKLRIIHRTTADGQLNSVWPTSAAA